MKNHGKRKDVCDALWWVGEIVECWHCRNRLELEQADAPRKEEVKFSKEDPREGGGPPDSTYYRVDCAVCGSENNVRIIEHHDRRRIDFDCSG